jgi:hypothetical protein
MKGAFCMLYGFLLLPQFDLQPNQVDAPLTLCSKSLGTTSDFGIFPDKYYV